MFGGWRLIFQTIQKGHQAMRSWNSLLAGRAARLLAAGLIVVAWQGAVLAANGTWNLTTGGTYGDAGNWLNNIVGEGATFTADFSTKDISSDVSVNRDTALTIGNMLFGDTNLASGGSWELATTNGSVLTLDNGASKPNMTVNTLTPAGFDDTFIGLILAGTNGFNKLGDGILTLGSTTNTITGGININAGTLRINGTIPGQAITMANNTTLRTGVPLDANIAPTGGFSLNVASGNTATIRATTSVELGNFNVAGATLNIVQEGAAGSTITADGDWAAGGGAAVMNVSSTNGGFLRLRPNGGTPAFNTTNAFATTRLNVDNMTVWVRTNSGGNDVNIGALTGTATAVLAGGAQGGGTAPRYIIGALNTDTTYAGSFDTGVALPVPQAGLHIVKVGTGKLTLSGTVNNVPRVGSPGTPATTTSAVTLPWRRGGVTQIQNGTIALVNSTVIAGGVTDTVANVGDMYSTIDVQTNGKLDVTGYTAGTYGTQSLQQIVGAGNIYGDWNHSTGFIRPANTVPDLGASTTITSPNTTAVAGMITFNGNFTLSGGSIGYDMSLDPNAGNDLVHVTGSANVTGGKIVPNFLNGIPSTGKYTVLTADGGITGSAAGLTVDFPGRGADPIPFIEGNSIKFNATSGGGSANLVWTGANGGVWNVETTQAWTNGGSPDVFFNLDNVAFNDAPTTSTVSIAQAVNPTSVVMNNPTTNYTFASTGGSIAGTGSFTKTGAGNLTMQIGNSYSGPTSLQGGTIDIGASTTPFGVGTMAVDGVTIVGTSSTGVGNTSLAATGAVTVHMEGTANSPGQFTLPALTGSGSFTLTSMLADKWFQMNSTTGYTGTVNMVGPDGQTPMHVRLVANSSFAVLNMNDTRISQRSGTAGSTSTFAIGELHGDDNTRLRAFEGGSPAVNANWQIGSANTNSDFAGVIEDGAGSGGTTSVSSVTKVGSGTLTLSGLNTYTGNTTVNGGKLSISQPYLADTADVFIANGALLDLTTGASDMIRSLYLNGVPQAPGTYGAGALGASFFTGTGSLMVTMLGPTLGVVGDYNNDGRVDAADYTVWRDNLGNPGTTLQHRDTANGTGVVSTADYTSWKTNFGMVAGPGAGGGSLSSVPEPASWLVALVAMVMVGAYRRERS
jgi:autotransporter-associated beta strand protein